jgi:hypothetical protein
MIQWKSLELKLKDYFEKGVKDKNRTFESTALQIENFYRDTVLHQAQDPFGNLLISINKFTLSVSLSRGFRDSLKINSGIPISLNGYGMIGLPLMWSGAQMSLDIPPPSSIRVLANTIVNPGIFPTLNIGGPDTMLKELMAGFEQHIKSISGMITALVPTGNTLVPLQFPWTGII